MLADMHTIDIEHAVTVLRQGGLVAFPTETVYGLGADAQNATALQKVFSAKGRPVDHPLIVHIADRQQLLDWAVSVSPVAEQLAQAFWPGPLTLILRRAPHVLDIVTGGQETIGLRVPNHPIAQKLLHGFGGGIAAPSANRFGHISPTTAEAVVDELGAAVDVILDGGACEVGLESTIIDLSRDQPAILRPGAITAADIAAVLDCVVPYSHQDAPRVSGMMLIHYAPRTRTQLVAVHFLPAFLQRLTFEDLPVVCLARRHPVWQRDKLTWVVMPERSQDYAHELYRVLRDVDKGGFKRIIIESVPEDAAWDAIRDRLQRATGSVLHVVS
ncbi:MAG: threonylcarbamoyl-AMP synthase [Gammaproteobacteria bacterium RIFCSPHIGHO2_12_FULL_41_20]|nr:MAG: threonylcarbamoyl-AMP synthase [Gammaproteobacteria bacterium RIFCSPHIGHO2_12_FULL_41_20]